MIEKELANLTIELIGLLTKIFQNHKISLDTYISNTMLKVSYLEEYAKNNDDNTENIKITKLLIQYNAMLKASCQVSR